MREDWDVLDLGCGTNLQPGAHGVDVINIKDVDWQHDLDEYPWPFPDDQFRIVYAFQVLEHLEDRVKVMQEIYRICKHGAFFIASVPDGCCPGYAQDPTHKSPWNLGTFMYFCPSQFSEEEGRPAYDFNVRFKIIDFHTRTRGRTPWGEPWNDNDLWVYLQVIK